MNIHIGITVYVSCINSVLKKDLWMQAEKRQQISTKKYSERTMANKYEGEGKEN